MDLIHRGFSDWKSTVPFSILHLTVLEIGLFLTACGSFCLFFGVVLLFDRKLLAMGDVCVALIVVLTL